jgi:hypothetical protein
MLKVKGKNICLRLILLTRDYEFGAEKTYLLRVSELKKYKS